MTQTIEKLLNDTERIVKHQKELSRLKGENFNIFSILNMESKENATHSAFLGELLNPKGSHNLGSLFLKLFLETVELKNHIQLETATVSLEFYIGKRNDKAKTGGRIDIFIQDANNHSVCIENKIYASDQFVQIARYCNYNEARNEVFYLTLDGSDPDEGSRAKKKSGEDFMPISYSSDIVEWLERCMKEATALPILRETISQYIILIKKLTNQLSDHKMDKDIQKLITDHYKAAKVISSNIGKIELVYAGTFVHELKEEVEAVLNKEDQLWGFEVSEDLNKTWTGIYITHKNWPKYVKVKLEGGSKIPWNNSIYGIHAPKDKVDRNSLISMLENLDLFESGFKSSTVWPYYKTILKFGHTSERAKLFTEESRGQLITETSKKLIEICTLCEKPLAAMNQY